MPEGDTIFRAARTLNTALAGQVVTKFETQLAHLARVDDDTPIAGRTVEGVRAFGKWMHMTFSGGLTLVTHMLMSGSWHIYRPNERWQQARDNMRVAIHTAAYVAVGFKVPVAEFHTADTLRRHRSMTSLGPDILSAGFDAQAASANLTAHPDREIGVAVLDQSVMAGIGNVYKSEVCFVSGVNPFRRVESLTALELGALLANARKLLQANVTDASSDEIVTYTGLRRTTGHSNPEERLWVYDRAGKACRKCGSPIQARKQGLDARATYWCPACQPL